VKKPRRRESDFVKQESRKKRNKQTYTNMNIATRLFPMNRTEQMKKIQSEALELFARKNADYGDAFAKFGTIGVLMRIEDKIQRALSITKNGVNLVKDEGIRDTLLDLHNYAAMALMLLDENE
jgi:carboxylesterase type B